MRLTSLLCASLAALCISSTTHAGTVDEIDFMVGKWGVVAFNNESDLMKMAGVARGYCGQPYTISRKGDDVIMYVEDKLAPVKLHNEGGKSYVVPLNDTNGVYEGAREINKINNNLFTLEYLESDLNARYGRNVFVRCK